MNRRHFLLLVAASTLLSACAIFPRDEASNPPIIFVHGNGGLAAQWTRTIWRFESNGWPRDRLFAFGVAHPFARQEDAKPQEGTTSTSEHTAQLAAEVERVRRLTGADKVVLIAHSRGGYAVRDYVRNGAGKQTVSKAILCGTPNHGVYSTPEYNPGSEFNGTAPFLAALNAPQGPNGEEVTPGVQVMTIRADGGDRYAQPDGQYIGQPKLRTNVSSDGPALKGAENIVLAGADHQDVAFSAEAFGHMYRFIAGKNPKTVDVTPERTLLVGGPINSLLRDSRTNLPLAGAMVEVFEVSPTTGERIGPAVHSRTTSADGEWGPFSAKPGASYEFVVRAEGYATTHTYRAPFPRSSQLVDLTPARLSDDDRKAGSVVQMAKVGGYLGLDRDRASIDGKNPPGIGTGIRVTGLSALRVPDDTVRSLVVELNGERIVVRTWPTRENNYVRAVFP